MNISVAGLFLYKQGLELQDYLLIRRLGSVVINHIKLLSIRMLSNGETKKGPTKAFSYNMEACSLVPWVARYLPSPPMTLCFHSTKPCLSSALHPTWLTSILSTEMARTRKSGEPWMRYQWYTHPQHHVSPSCSEKMPALKPDQY